MTAFEYHFETMPIPTRVAYYSHYLPKSWLTLTNIFVNLVELILPWIIFVPAAALRLSVFYLQVNIIERRLKNDFFFARFCILIAKIYFHFQIDFSANLRHSDWQFRAIAIARLDYFALAADKRSCVGY